MTETHKKLMGKNYHIFVPSRNRSSLIEKRGGVWKYLGRDSYPVTVIVRQEEEEKYSKEVESRIPEYDVRVSSVPNKFMIVNKRQRMLDLAIEDGVEYMFILDDDICLYYRDEELSSKYTSKEEEFLKRDSFNNILYESMKLCSEEFPIVGLPLKQGSFNLKYTFPKNIPIIRFVCYHVPTLIKENVRMDGLGTTFMSDRYAHLSLLEKGYASLSNCRWCVGDHGTGYKGGCADTRTAELQGEAAKALSKRFGEDRVSLKWKEDGVWGVRRLDCRIEWKKFLPVGSLSYLPKEEGRRRINE